MQGRTLAGIVTDRDLRSRVVAEGLSVTDPVPTIMTPSPVTVDADAVVFEVILEMVTRNINHLPIIEDGTPIGVLTTDCPLYTSRCV